jgi:hypothetical protein
MKRFNFVLIAWILITIIGSYMKIYHIVFADIILLISLLLMIIGVYLFFKILRKK